NDSAPSRRRTQTCRYRKAITALSRRAPSNASRFRPREGTWMGCGSLREGRTVLNIGRLAPGAADYYIGEVATSAEDYYTGKGEARGRWVGSLWPQLGL